MSVALVRPPVIDRVGEFCSDEHGLVLKTLGVAAAIADQVPEVKDMSGGRLAGGIFSADAILNITGIVPKAASITGRVENLGAGTNCEDVRGLSKDIADFAIKTLKVTKWLGGIAILPLGEASKTIGGWINGLTIFKCTNGVYESTTAMQNRSETDPTLSRLKDGKELTKLVMNVMTIATHSLALAGVLFGVVASSPLVLGLSSVALTSCIANYFIKQEIGYVTP